MLRVAVSTVVAAPPERVWALYSDMERTVEWVPFVEEVLYVSGPLEVGMVYRERTRLLGITGVQEWRVVELEAPSRRVEVSRDLAMDGTLVITLRPVAGGTRLRQEARFRSRLPPPLGWLHEAGFALVSRWAMARAIEGAKRTVEGKQAAA
jgi:uncharacterized protein YndB with AHSA1/START domain